MTQTKETQNNKRILRGKLPLYVQIAEQIARQITAGHLVEGQMLPPERDMAASYQISVGTLRKALARLGEMKLIKAVHGSGNYITRTENASSLYSFFRLETHQGGGLPRAELLGYDFRPKPQDLPQFGQEDHAHRFRRLRFLDDIPIALEEIWLDGHFKGDVSSDDISESLYQFYKDHFGLWIIAAEDWVGTGTIPTWAPAHFPLGKTAPCGFVERFGTSQKNAIVEYSRTWFNSATARYVSRLK